AGGALRRGSIPLSLPPPPPRGHRRERAAAPTSGPRLADPPTRRRLDLPLRSGALPPGGDSLRLLRRRGPSGLPPAHRRRRTHRSDLLRGRGGDTDRGRGPLRRRARGDRPSTLARAWRREPKCRRAQKRSGARDRTRAPDRSEAPLCRVTPSYRLHRRERLRLLPPVARVAVGRSDQGLALTVEGPLVAHVLLVHAEVLLLQRPDALDVLG